MLRIISKNLRLAGLIFASGTCGTAFSSSDNFESKGSIQLIVENDTSSAFWIQEWSGPSPTWYGVQVDKPTYEACSVARSPEVSRVACGALGPDAEKLEPGENATHTWDGIFWPKGDKGDNICAYQQIAPAEEYSVEFCWGPKSKTGLTTTMATSKKAQSDAKRRRSNWGRTRRRR